MVYADARQQRARAARSTCPKPTARAFRSTTPTVELARQALIDRAALRLPDGHRMGQGRRDRQDLHPAGAPGDRAEPRRPHDPALHARGRSRVLASGRSIGQRIGAGPARVVRDVQGNGRVQTGDVLVADMTDPDWEPVMKRASAIVTNRGGRTCHAAIIARELGIPAVVGCGDATERDRRRQRRDGVLRRRRHGLRLRRHCSDSSRRRSSSTRCRRLRSRIMMNVGNPDRAFDFAGIPEPGRGPGAPRVHHQPHDRRASAGAARVRPARRRAQGDRSAGRWRATRPGELLRREARRGHRARSPPRSRRSR